MQITIDSFDGHGAVDYSETVRPQGPITITRRLNAPSTCTVELVPQAVGLAVPARRARVVVRAEDGTTLFTGYLATEPLRVYAGQTTTGPVYGVKVTSLSDEWLLDRPGPVGVSGLNVSGLGQDTGELLQQLTSRVQSGSRALTLEVAGSLRATGAVSFDDAANWSTNAQLAANAGYAAYRVLGGQVAVQPVAAVVHTLVDGDGKLDPSALTMQSLRELANDVTVSGAEEPAAFITEVFVADGATTEFTLNDPAFQGTQQSLLWDAFEDAVLNASRWTLSDSGGHLGLSGGGLAFDGGNGEEGQTTLTSVAPVEMGGTLVVELGGVLLSAGSDGVLGGFYSGQPLLTNCVAGFRVRPSASSTGSGTVLVPVLNGLERGAEFAVVEGRAYTLRLRLHCAEMYRFAQPYYCMADGVVREFGGTAGLEAALHVTLDVVDEGGSSSIPAAVLYDSHASGAAIEGSPALCSFVVVNAVQMFGSVRSVRLDQQGSLWVASTLPSGESFTRVPGVAGQTVDYELRSGGQAGAPATVVFFAGRVPVAGERVSVFYRGQRRAIARRADAASVASEAMGNESGTSRWLGKVLQPPARTSVDCESAALAVLAMATSRSAALAGRYTCVNPAEDIWPGDVLQVTSEGITSALLVRSVVVTDGHAVPEVRRYDLAFANDWATEWADGLGLKLSEEIAADAELPQTAASETAAALENLPALSVVSLTGTSLQVDAGVDPVSGGGFEVRRRDGGFGAETSAAGTSGAGLVLRSPVRNFAIPRATQSERFYMRMFDGSTPPIYSSWSSAVFVHAPVD